MKNPEKFLNGTSNEVVDAVSLKASSGDIRGLMSALPGLELLWKHDPPAYLGAVKIDVHALIASSDPEARAAVLTTFSNVMDKTSPSDTVAATAYFGLKWKIISDYCNLEEVRANKQLLNEPDTHIMHVTHDQGISGKGRKLRLFATADFRQKSR